MDLRPRSKDRGSPAGNGEGGEFLFAPQLQRWTTGGGPIRLSTVGLGDRYLALPLQRDQAGKVGLGVGESVGNLAGMGLGLGKPDVG
jgi:hypothetical protein